MHGVVLWVPQGSTVPCERRARCGIRESSQERDLSCGLRRREPARRGQSVVHALSSGHPALPEHVSVSQSINIP